MRAARSSLDDHIRHMGIFAKFVDEIVDHIITEYARPWRLFRRVNT